MSVGVVDLFPDLIPHTFQRRVFGGIQAGFAGGGKFEPNASILEGGHAAESEFRFGFADPSLAWRKCSHRKKIIILIFRGWGPRGGAGDRGCGRRARQ